MEGRAKSNSSRPGAVVAQGAKPPFVIPAEAGIQKNVLPAKSREYA